ncbi:MAG TPA: hypothetical protein VGI70_22235, partial [Polyangiales bacterium]
GFSLPEPPGHGGGKPPHGDDDSGIAMPMPECEGPPGLYVDGSCTKLAQDIREYRPKYELWNDGATKERFIYLPPDTTIDTTNPDRWTFPQGTRLYKTFSVNGVRVETRLIEKTGTAASVDSWTFTAYAWSADQKSAAPADPAGVVNALGTTHDIPAQAQCKSCHTMPNLDAVNGFEAIQLNHPGAITSLELLIAEKLLVNGVDLPPNVTLDSARFPGDAHTQAGLGYLHANCGHCHGGPAPKVGLSLWTMVGEKSVSDAPAIKTGSCQCLQKWIGRSNPAGDAYARRIAPGHADISGVIGRMSVRGAGEQMPPLGTKVVDDDGVAAVSRFIDALDPNSCDETVACPPPAAAGSAAPVPTAGSAAPAPSAGSAGAGPTAGAPAPITP